MPGNGSRNVWAEVDIAPEFLKRPLFRAPFTRPGFQWRRCRLRRCVTQPCAARCRCTRSAVLSSSLRTSGVMSSTAAKLGKANSDFSGPYFKGRKRSHADNLPRVDSLSRSVSIPIIHRWQFWPLPTLASRHPPGWVASVLSSRSWQYVTANTKGLEISPGSYTAPPSSIRLTWSH